MEEGRQGQNKIVTKSNEMPKTDDSIPAPGPGWVVLGRGGAGGYSLPAD
jgi:hypothetical protein